MRLIRYMLFVALVASLSSAGIVGLTKDITAVHAQGHDITQVYANGVVWSSSSAFSPLDLSPVLWWRMDESAGNTTVSDSAGSNTGTAYQNTSAMHTTGVTGGALKFNGTSNGVYVSDNPSLRTTNAITFTCWVRVYDDSAWKIIANKDNAYGWYVRRDINNVVSLQIKTSDLTLYVIKSTTTLTVAAGWMHVAFTYDKINDDVFRLYINGAQNAVSGVTGNKSLSIREFEFRVGYYSPEFQVLNGAVDDVLLFNRALTPTEILQIYNWRE